MDLIKLGKLLYDVRKTKDLSLRDAAELIGVSHNYLSILEKANDPRSNSPIRPTIETLKMISDAYKIDINELLSLSGYDDITVQSSQTHLGDLNKITTPQIENYPEFLKLICKFKEGLKERGMNIDDEPLEKTLDRILDAAALIGKIKRD